MEVVTLSVVGSRKGSLCTWEINTMSSNQSIWRAARSLGRGAAIVGALFIAIGCTKPPPVNIPAEPKAKELVVVTPHNELIRSAFENAFSEWHKEKHGRFVQIQWVAAGTPQCVQYVKEAGRPDFVPTGRPIPDVLFGGGPFDHQTIADQGLSRPVDMGEVEADITAALKGIPTRDPQNRWHSSALSGFGILVAEKSCRQRGIALPASWKDLADPRFYGWVAIADARRSGSNRHCLLTILQKYGWDEGWGINLRIAANCRALAGGSAEVVRNVSTGSCLAGFCVNFSALREIEQRGEGVLAYVTPSDANAITPDPVSVLTYALHPGIGERFARFCVSDAGQRIWAFKAQFRGGHNDTLFHYPIRPAFYTEHREMLGVSENPFEMPSILPVDLELEKKWSPVIGPVLQAACGDNHVMLQRCWQGIIDSGMNQAALAELLKPVVSESEAADAAAGYQSGGEGAEALVRDWSERFKQKYERVEGILAGS